MSVIENLSNNIINAIRSVIGSDKALLHEPSFTGNEWEYVKDCIDSTVVSSVGEYVDRFESDLANYTNSKYAIAVINGTSALHIALLVAGIKVADEVLMPALTFVATANAVSYCGAYPHFVDSDKVTLGIDAGALRDYLNVSTIIKNNQCVNKSTGRIIRAIVPMHTFGHPVDIEGILEIAHDFNLVVIEDAAESLGSKVGVDFTGTFGSMGIYSFNGNKTITAGGGGAIVTNNTELAKKAKHLSTTAKVSKGCEFVHDAVGYNYRMPNINAALVCAQLEQLPNFIDAKRNLFARYDAVFRDIENVHVFREPKGARSNYWLQTLVLDESIMSYRDRIISDMNTSQIMARPVWELLNNMEPYKNCPKMDLSVATLLSKKIINIPSSASLGMNFLR